MKVSTKLITTLAIAGLAFAPTSARADLPPVAPCIGTFSLGLGGYLGGCWNLSVGRLFEYADDTGPVAWFSDPFGRDGTGAPTGVTNTLWSDYEAGATSATGTGAYFGGTFFGTPFVNGAHPTDPQSIAWNGTELIFGLQDPVNGWVYSGKLDPLRNDIPSPAGIQNVLLRVTDDSGNPTPFFLFGWEDRNSGCTADTAPTTITQTQVVTASVMNSLAATCTTWNAGDSSDRDYNDFYFLISADQIGIPQDSVPEPVTMTLLATGLVGLGGASLRKRNKKS